MRGWLCSILVCLAVLLGAAVLASPARRQEPSPWISIPGGNGPGKGKRIVLIAADEEYRSEETLPQFAQILAKRHGFDCIVLFGIDPKDGTVCPNVTDNIPGLENLKRADLVIMLIRWRNLPNDQMKAIVDYAESGRPMIGMRTATHPFNLKAGPYLKTSWDYTGADYEGGFGRQVFGETWISHHGEHGKQGTRGILAAGQEKHPILRGIAPGTIFGLSDVYGVRLPLLGDSQPLVLGEVTETLDPKSGAAAGSKNAPMMPVAWTRTYRGASGRSARVFTTTMGAAQDFAFEGTRRMLVNAVYWSLGMEKRIPAKSAIDFVGEFKPSPFKFRTLDEWKPGRTPADLQSPAGSSEPITPKAYPALDRTQGVPASGRKYQIRPAIAGIGTKYRSQQQGVGIPALVVPEVENPRHQKTSVFQTRLVRRTIVLSCRGFSTSGQYRPPIATIGTKLVMAHYMPWFEADPEHRRWGWHWTMNHYHPENMASGRAEAASHYAPLIGLYDSNDPDALECQVLLMKLSGIDGVIVDWYGTDDLYDYKLLHRNTLHLIELIKKAGMRFAICYEDQTVPKLIAAKRFAASEAVEHGRELMQWLQAHWFSDPSYLKLDGRPALLVFGPQYYHGGQWTQMFEGLSPQPLFIAELDRRDGSDGSFDWPEPGGGTEESAKARERFFARATAWPVVIPAAYPRFHDIYADAGVSKGYGRIEDRDGKTYRETLTSALTSSAPVAQIVTWNDWGEGTMIEPSVEFGYRDLEATQELCRKYVRPSPFTAEDLRLSATLYRLRKQHKGEAAKQVKLDEASRLLFAGKPKPAKAILAR